MSGMDLPFRGTKDNLTHSRSNAITSLDYMGETLREPGVLLYFLVQPSRAYQHRK